MYGTALCHFPPGSKRTGSISPRDRGRDHQVCPSHLLFKASAGTDREESLRMRSRTIVRTGVRRRDASVRIRYLYPPSECVSVAAGYFSGGCLPLDLRSSSTALGSIRKARLTTKSPTKSIRTSAGPAQTNRSTDSASTSTRQRTDCPKIRRLER